MVPAAGYESRSFLPPQAVECHVWIPHTSLTEGQRMASVSGGYALCITYQIFCHCLISTECL